MAAFILLVTGIEREGYCPTACATSPVLVGRDRNFRNWSDYQGRNQRWVGPYGSALTSLGQQALALVEVWTSGSADLEFPLPCSSKIVQNSNRRFWTQRHDHVPNTSQWSQHRFQNSARSARTRSVESVQQCHNIRQKQSFGGGLPLSRALFSPEFDQASPLENVSSG